ncbi:hypothetical protein WH52_07935 [Tenacibaculum holothuriorum]|uniref:RNA polymerase sigma factor SigZ n=1 Tax=Tenacibaculum holothuriorum TaxID=1635173 RepID=A0A1Y2PE55_9FLAO|nr:sigma-70 family RNA polymerase sigma factor [Tenacibaculum holothuriorum]OSY87958.1 hypothetical protein WH52_07935 [Tenacibaculum holothuriorum]
MMKKECCNINEVVQEFYDYLRAYIFKKTKDSRLADDLVQEVMIKLVETHQKAKDIKNVKAWLFQVSRNAIYDYFTKNNLSVSIDDDWKLNSIKDDEESLVKVEDYVLPMINMLPKQYAVALKMSDIDNIPQKEIAKELDLGLSATKMRIQRARTKLRALFVECCDIEYDKQGDFIGCSIKESCEPLQNTSKKLKDKTL